MVRYLYPLAILYFIANTAIAQQSPKPLRQTNEKAVVQVRKPGETYTTMHAKDNRTSVFRAGSMQSSGAEAGTTTVIVEFKEDPFFVQQQQHLPGIKPSAFTYKERFVRLSNDMARSNSNLTRVGKSRVAEGSIKQKYYKVFYGASIALAPELIDSVRKLSYVKKIYTNDTVKAILDKSVPLIKADQVWSQLGSKGEGIVVGIIDTGIDYTHPDLGGGFGAGFKVMGGYDFVNKDNDPKDDNFHGTHCAGIVAADGVYLKGVAPKAKLVALKALDSNGSGTWDNIIAAIEWASDPNNDDNANDKLDIVSMSLGGSGNPDDALSQAVDNAVSLGMLFCVAAGNNYEYSAISSPGTARLALTVGASDDFDQMANFSSKGPNTNIFSIKPEVIAPGVGIHSTVLNGAYASYNGTSMATPHVAGVAALLKKLHPDWTPAQIKSAIVTTAKDLNFHVMVQGAGRVDAFKAASVSSFAAPAQLSFGLDDLTKPVWTMAQTVLITNKHTIAQAYAVQAAGLNTGITLQANPAAFTLAPGASRSVVFTLAVNNTTVVDPSHGSKSYGGQVTITGAKDVMHLPWAFVKSPKLTLTFDKPFPSFTIVSQNNYYSTGNATLSDDGLSAELLVAKGTYDMLFLMDQSWNKIVIRESILVAGSIAFHISSAEATRAIKPRAVDENGNQLATAAETFAFLFPSGASITHSSVFFGAHRDEYYLSNVSSRFTVLTNQTQVDIPNGKIYQVQYTPLNGITSDVTLKNSPAQYLIRDVQLQLKPGASSNEIIPYTHIKDINNYGAFGIGDVLPLVGDKWHGKVYLTPPTHTVYQYALSFGSIFNKDFFLFTQYLNYAEGKIGAFVIPPPQPDIFLSEPGQTLVFGKGAIYPFSDSPYGAPCWQVLFYGQLRENRVEDGRLATYQLFNAQNTLVKSGNLNALQYEDILSGKNKLVAKNNNYVVGGFAGKATLTTTFDQSLTDTKNPNITSLQVRNHKGVPSEVLEYGASSSIRFSFDDEALNQSTVKLYLKLSGTTTWKEVAVNKIYQSGYGTLLSPVGALYIANVTTFPTASGAVDLRITAADNSGNSTDWILEPGLVVEDKEPDSSVCTATGTILREYWANVTGSNIAAIPVNKPPTSTSQVTSFQGPLPVAGAYGVGDNYATRYRGYLCVPTTGNYTFWLASDNDGELWLSTDQTVNNKVRLAYIQDGFVAVNQWTKYPTQKSGLVSLVAGQKYYIEALHKEASGGDQLQIGWRLPTSAANANPVVIPGSVLSPFVLSNLSPTVSLTAPLKNAVFAFGSDIVLVANPNDSDGTIAKVEFFNGAVKLGESFSSPYSFTINKANAGSYALTAKATDNLGATTTSATVEITVSLPTTCTATGTILREYWANVTGSNIAAIPVNKPPTSTSQVTSFQGPLPVAGAYGVGENYATRYRGYLCVPTTGNYTFWLASDNDGELWLSTDQTANNKVRLAYIQDGFVAVNQWTKYPTQKSGLVSLVAGQKYYIEAFHKEASGGDQLQIGWRLPTSAANANPVVIPGSVLSPFMPAPARIGMDEDKLLAVDNLLTVYPNPFSSKTDVEFTVEKEGQVALQLFDLRGIKLKSLFEGNAEEDKIHTREINGNTLTDGVYILCFTTSTGIIHKKIVLTRE